ncbi:hypothetical protein C8Q80DRAFT_1108864, partial [Daedaleopsis nitida]
DVPGDNSGDSRSIEPHTSGEQQHWQRDPVFWFEDGTAVLIAGGVGFRIYRGVLADRLPVFRNIFPGAQSPHRESSGGGSSWSCPEVYLSDSPEALRELLQVLRPAADSSLFAAEHPTYERIAACIRLGHNYQITSIVSQALSYLRRFYTPDFDAVEQIDQLVPHKFTFALCCTLRAHELVDGFALPDGSREVLSSADLALCVQANRALVHEHVALVFHVFKPEAAPGCTGRGACVEGMRKLLSEHGDRVLSFTTPLPFAKWRFVTDLQRSVVCPACFLLLKKREEDQRQEIWNKLPALIGITVER